MTKTVRYVLKAKRTEEGESSVRVGYIRISLPSCSCRTDRITLSTDGIPPLTGTHMIV